MHHLAQLGLYETAPATTPDDERAELRLVEGHALVAWFQTTCRQSDGERILGTSSQFVVRSGLTREQVSAVEQWLDRQFRPERVQAAA